MTPQRTSTWISISLVTIVVVLLLFVDRFHIFGKSDVGHQAVTPPIIDGAQRQAPKKGRPTIKPINTPSDFRNEGTITIQGNVLDEKRTNVSGALVGLFDRPELVETNYDGQFSIEDVPSGAHIVIARKGELIGRAISVMNGHTTIHLRRGASATVKVIDANTQRPIEGATVSGTTFDGVTTLSGTIAIPGITSDSTAYRVMAVGYEQVGFSLRVLQEHRPVTRTIELHRGVITSGDVTDDNGVRISNARVNIISPETGSMIALSSDANGEWHTTLAIGRHELEVRAVGFDPTRTEFDVRENEDRVRTVLVSEVECSGIVRNQRGIVSNARINTSDGRGVSVDLEGKFRISGRTHVWAEVDGAASMVVATGPSCATELTLEVIETSISVITVDSGGKPLADANVRLMSSQVGTIEGMSDSDGLFVVDGIPISTYHVVATHRSEDQSVVASISISSSHPTTSTRIRFGP